MKKYLILVFMLIFVSLGFSAKIVCVNTPQYREGLNNIGDIIGVFEDSHNFSETEKAAFTIISVRYTVEQVNNFLQSLEPKEIQVYKDIDSKWKIYYDTMTYTEGITPITIWKDGTTWRRINKRPKYRKTLNGLTQTVINALNSTNATVRQTAIQQIKNAIELYQENKVESVIVE